MDYMIYSVRLSLLNGHIYSGQIENRKICEIFDHTAVRAHGYRHGYSSRIFGIDHTARIFGFDHTAYVRSGTVPV
jgi:hypothetical protein